MDSREETCSREADNASSPPLRVLDDCLERLAGGFTPSLEEDTVFAYQNPEPEQTPESVGEETPEKPNEGQ